MSHAARQNPERLEASGARQLLLKLVTPCNLSLELLVGADKLCGTCCHQSGQFIVSLLQDLPDLARFGDIRTGPNQPHKAALGLDSGYSMIQYPPVLSISAFEPILHTERLMGARC